MREIKFRAWNKEIKCFYDDILCLSKNFNGWKNLQNLIFLQYIGIKDKNGFYLSGFTHDNFDGEEVEVIGNIYENQDLYQKYVL